MQIQTDNNNGSRRISKKLTPPVADLSRAMAAKLSMVTEQKSRWRNLTNLHMAGTRSQLQHRSGPAAAASATSKGTHTRAAPALEHARLAMKRPVTVLKTLVRHAHHSIMPFPERERERPIRKRWLELVIT